MIAKETVEQLQHAPASERIQVIEALLESLKQDIVSQKFHEATLKPFTVRTFNLGTDISFDRDEMYAERGF